MEDKKQVILDIALEHFSKFGYEGSSTNQMVLQAGFSKGILFHYFSNKKQLYAKVLESALQRIADFVAIETREPSSDFFERILHNSYVKVKFFVQEPATYHLLVNSFFGTVPSELEEVISQYRSQFAKHSLASFNDMDASRLRPGVTPAIALDMITSISSILTSRFVEEHKKQPDHALHFLEEFVENMRPYLKIIELGIYQQPTEGEE